MKASDPSGGWMDGWAVSTPSPSQVFSVAAGGAGGPWGHHSDSSGGSLNVRTVSVSPGVCELG